MAFLGPAKVAVKGSAGLQRAFRPFLFKRQLNNIYKSVKSVEGVLPGFRFLEKRTIIQTDVGKVLFSSNVTTGGSVIGACNHNANEVLKKAGKAGSLELAEAIVIGELRAIAKAFPKGKISKNAGKPNVEVQTTGGVWEVAADIDKNTGLLTIFHLVPKKLF